jgi:hypothetical protein
MDEDLEGDEDDISFDVSKIFQVLQGMEADLGLQSRRKNSPLKTDGRNSSRGAIAREVVSELPPLVDGSEMERLDARLQDITSSDDNESSSVSKGIRLRENGEGNGDSESIAMMEAFMQGMDSELAASHLGRTFLAPTPPEGVAASATSAASVASPLLEESSGSGSETDVADLLPVDLDMNLVKNLMASFSAQEGTAGPVSNIMGHMGIGIPDVEDETHTSIPDE